MTKSLMISIQPKHLVNILNGYKTLELRKSVPKDYKGWVNIYCTKSKKIFRVGSLGFYEDILYRLPNGEIKFGFPYENEKKIILNGKVVARFWFDEYDTYYWNEYQGQYRLISKDKERFVSAIMSYDELCLNEKQVNDYGNEKHLLYTWHIKHLEIFDKPMELKNFHKLSVGKETSAYIRLDKAPQSWQYVYVK